MLATSGGMVSTYNFSNIKTSSTILIFGHIYIFVFSLTKPFFRSQDNTFPWWTLEFLVEKKYGSQLWWALEWCNQDRWALKWCNQDRWALGSCNRRSWALEWNQISRWALECRPLLPLHMARTSEVATMGQRLSLQADSFRNKIWIVFFLCHE